MIHPLRAARSSLCSLPSLALAASLALVGCAAAPPPMGVSAAEPPPSLFGPSGAGTSPVDSEMLAISKSEQEIDRLLPDADKERSRRKAGPSSGEAQKADRTPTKDAQASTPIEGDGCATACRALASMERSAAHLCSLAGEGDGRCEDARGRVRGAGARVRSACPACAAQPQP